MAVELEVWGDYACFSRPEMKVERVSYDVITPSAARGLLEAIMWHPGMKWIIDSIQVCNPIRFTNIRRNEVSAVVSASKVQKAMKEGKNNELFISTKDTIQQRAAMVLQDVRYVIKAHFEMTEKANSSDNPGKFQEMIIRRIEKGQCYHTPYFGVREFAAHFQLCSSPPECPEELKGKKDLGWMLYDMDYTNPEDIRPRFFRAIMQDGFIKVPKPISEEVVE
ncbi:MAG: type I-C CRISPR-associated protein Cas5c [Lachnospiraceae bacterium]|nr:type I-C CRISPR-associated protein Cas5c [Lachnospiraceae bacterium]